MKHITKLSTFALGLIAVGIPTPAQEFSFTTIDPPGSTFTFPFGISPQATSSGTILGAAV